MLTLPPFQFANLSSNLPFGTGTGTPPAALVGTNFTAGLNNSDGTAVGILGALASDMHYLVVGIGGISLSTANSQCLLDVLIDRAGGTSWSQFISDLVCGFTPIPTAGAIGIQQWYHFPIWIPSGASIGIQARTRHSANITTGRVIMYAYGNPSRPDMWWCGQGVESLGIDAANSQGTNVTPGNTGAWGGWATIGTSTARYGAVQFGLNGSDATSTAIGYYWQLGVGSNQLPGSPTCFTANTTAEVAQKSGFSQPIWCDVPTSTAWQVRGTASGTAEVHNAAVYGVY